MSSKCIPRPDGPPFGRYQSVLDNIRLLIQLYLKVCFGDELRLVVKAAKFSAGDSVVYSIAEKGAGNRGGKDNSGGTAGGATLTGSYEVTAEDLEGGSGRKKKGGRKGRSGKGKVVSMKSYNRFNHLATGCPKWS